MTALIGRTDEIANADQWMASGGRVLTIAGPPGVGKSRLAHEVAGRHGGALSCDLTTCRTSADVEQCVQRALGGVSRARLARVLGAFEGLVVLDPFEHLVEAARGLIETWTSRPGPRFVIASREPLGLLAERTLLLGPLEEADALALYAARAGRSVEPRTAAAIVARLDRLPLAIELAAARAAVLSEHELLARLERGLDAIDSPSTNLRATIRWSIDLLRPDERTTLLQCAVFRGPFDGRAAESVVRGDDAPVDTIACLVALEQKSLLRRAGVATDPRVALYDAVREVGLEELAREGSLERVTRRHADHYTRLADDTLDPAAARALASEAADLAAAQRFMQPRDPLVGARLALALDRALAGQAPSSAHIELLSAAVRCAEHASDPLLTAKALAARAQAHRLLGATRLAKRDLRQALALARARGPSVVEADVLRLLGVVARQLSRGARARVLLERALAIYEELGQPKAAAVVLDDLGVVAHDLGELMVARDSYERALALERAFGDRRFEGITRAHLGLIAHDLGDLEQAEVLYREALALHRESGDRRFEGFAHAFLAAAMLERSELEAAQRSLETAAAIDARLGDVDSGALLAGIGCAVAAASGHLVEGRAIVARSRVELAGRDDEALRRMLDVFGMALEVAEAHRARAEGRPDAARAHLDAVRQALARGERPSCVEQRLAHRVVGRLLDREVGAGPKTRVADDGTWFDSGGGRVSLGTRRALALMLGRLACERQVAPERSVGVDALFQAGWPGERAAEGAARRRVYVGIDTLRSLGLRAAIVQRDRGYFLDPGVEVRGAAAALNEP